MFLTRPEHDLLLHVNQPLLVSLFDKLSYSWGLAGVTFRNVPAETVESVHAILYAKPANN